MSKAEGVSEDMQRMTGENEELRRELWKYKSKPTGIIGYELLLCAAVTLIASIFYTSTILVFVGVALSFWGGIFLFIRPVRFVKARILHATAHSSCLAINGILETLHLNGRGLYLPPRSLKTLKRGIVFVPKQPGIVYPPLQVLAGEKIFLDSVGIGLIPPGLELANLYEEELNTDFNKVDAAYLIDNLPKVIVEGLELAEEFKMEIKADIVNVRIKGSIYESLCFEMRKLSNLCGQVGCPICSSFACVLARVTGKPVVMNRHLFDDNNHELFSEYQILEEPV